MTIPTVITITPDNIYPNPWQTRQTIDPDGLESLADSIERDGLLQPILVRTVRRDRYELIAGQRRLMAWKLVEERGKTLGGIPAIVREIDDRQMVLDTLTENLKREDVDLIEETRAMARAMEQVEDLSQKDLAELLETSPGQVSNRLRLLKLPDSVLQLVTEGKLAWTSARELLCLVGDDHTHEDEIEAVLKGLPSYKDTWTGQDVRDTVAEVCVKKPARWRPLEDVGESRFSWYSYYASGKNAPIFDVEAFRKEHPKSVHKLPKRGDSGHYLWTCAGKEWKAAQKKAKEDLKIEAPPDPKREAWTDAMVKDQVAKKLGLEREKFSSENSLTEDELDALGTRSRFVKGEGRSQLRQIAGTGYNSPPDFFSKRQCFASCTEGAVYAENNYGYDYVLKCGNATCYDAKWQEGLDRFKFKEQKRADQTDTVRRKLADEVRPVLTAHPDLARGLLSLITQKIIDGRATRPLGYGADGDATAYHSAAILRLTRLLGLEGNLEDNASLDLNFWTGVDAQQIVQDLDDPVPAATEALSIALQEAGFAPGD